jgi:hypothetical protein
MDAIQFLQERGLIKPGNPKFFIQTFDKTFSLTELLDDYYAAKKLEEFNQKFPKDDTIRARDYSTRRDNQKHGL